MQGQWVETQKIGRCQTLPREEAIRIICKDQMVIRDALGGIHKLGIEPKDVSWDLLPVQSVDATWALGVGGVIMDDCEE